MVRNVGINVDVDEQGLNRTIKLYLQLFGDGVAKFLKSQARLLCFDMMDYTVPFDPDPPERFAGRNAMARIKGEESLEADIKYVFQPLARAGWADIAAVDDFGIFNAWVISRKNDGYSVPSKFEDGMFTATDWQKFRSVWNGKPGFFSDEQEVDYSTVYGGIESTHIKLRGGTRTKDYKEHMVSRNSNGKRNVFLVADISKRDTYIKKVKKRVGTLKAGWYSAAVALNDWGVKLTAPSWIIGNQHGSGIMVNQLSSRPYMSVEVGNSFHNLMTEEYCNGQWKNAISHRAYAIRQKIAKRLSNRKAETVEAAVAKLEAHGLFEIEQDPF